MGGSWFNDRCLVTRSCAISTGVNSGTPIPIDVCVALGDQFLGSLQNYHGRHYISVLCNIALVTMMNTNRYGTILVIADRWFPSSKLCSRCDYRLPELSLSVQEWICPECGMYHDRDANAAENLKRLATCFICFANEQIALPVANLAVTSGT